MSYINKKRLVKEFISLLKVDSPSLEEKEISRIVTLKLKSLGLKVSVDKAGDKIAGNAGNIYAFFLGNTKKIPALFLNAHLDTVKPGKSIKPYVQAGYIRSRGDDILGADDKAGVAIILEVLRVLKERNLPHGNLEVIFTVAEEIGLKGAKNFNSKKIKSDFGYVLDGGRNLQKLVVAAPSQKTFTARFIGKAAHAGIHPENGINAIAVAAGAISQVKLGRLDQETTANIGVIEGGVATNIVPEKVTVRGEVRSHSFSKLNKKIGRIKKIFAETAGKAGAHLKWQEETEYFNYKLSSRSKVVRAFVRAAKNWVIKVKFGATGGGSDANVFNQAGVPAAVVPVGMEDPHSKKEQIKIKTFVSAAELILELVQTVAGGNF